MHFNSIIPRMNFNELHIFFKNVQQQAVLPYSVCTRLQDKDKTKFSASGGAAILQRPTKFKTTKPKTYTFSHDGYF